VDRDAKVLSFCKEMFVGLAKVLSLGDFSHLENRRLAGTGQFVHWARDTGQIVPIAGLIVLTVPGIGHLEASLLWHPDCF
jgi:hypothetical protein